jgi:hypothetical protein
MNSKVYPIGEVHLALNAFGPSTVEQVHKGLAADPFGPRLSRSTVSRALHALVVQRAAFAVVQDGIATYHLRRRALLPI